MFRLGCVIPNVTDGTSFYRAGGPLQAMEQERPRDIRLEMGGTINWVYLRGVNAVFMQRPYTADHVRVMSFCKLQGKPIWIDYDDDLYSVPFQNPAHKFYSPKQIQNHLTSLIAQADIVSVSTVALKTKLEKILERFAAAKTDLPRRFLSPEKIVVIPNAYDEKLFAYSYRSWTKPPPDANLCALWRGSNTHDADLAAYTDPLKESFKSSGENWTMNFVGSPWWGTIKAMQDAGISSDRTIITPPLDPIEYFHFLHRVKPAVVFVPLVDDVFNRSKSNIAWIEASHAGAVCLAPDWEEWRRPGVLLYRDQEDFRQKLSMLLEGGVNRCNLVGRSREFIGQNLTLAAVNHERWKIIECLSAIDPWT